MRCASLIDTQLRLGLPGDCAFCLGRPIPGESWCEACLEALPWNRLACANCAEPLPGTVSDRPSRCGRCMVTPPSFRHAHVPLRYEDDMTRLIQQFKFSASPRAGHLLLRLFLLSLPSACEQPMTTQRPQALISVPLHPTRARQRGFDQAHWLAKRLGHRLGLPCLTAKRLRETPSQRGLKRQARLENLKHAFTIKAPLPPCVALVDDVMTTGATFEALAAACHEAGAEEVQVWALARTPMG